MTAALKIHTDELSEYVLNAMDNTARRLLIAEFLERAAARVTKDEKLRQRLMEEADHYLDSELIDGRTISIEYDDGEEKYVPQPDELPR